MSGNRRASTQSSLGRLRKDVGKIVNFKMRIPKERATPDCHSYAGVMQDGQAGPVEALSCHSDT